MRDRNSVISASPTLKLLRTVGSPFSLEFESPQDSIEAIELYDYASKNKIGLTYLEALRTQGSLGKFGLELKYEEEKRKYNELRLTASQVAHLLNSAGINYAVFKSIMPFAMVTNDIDILHLGSTDEYYKAVDIIAKADYIMIVESGPVPLQIMFHDSRDGPHPVTGQKDVYDIDLYREASASYIIYLDKKKLARYVTETSILSVPIKVLKPEADLIAMVAHALFPELLYTLSIYYTTLHYLKGLGPQGINEFICIAKENNVTLQVKAHCSLTGMLHQEAHGFVPNELEEVLSRFGKDSREVNMLLRTHLKTPHRYSWATVMNAFLEKSREGRFRRSAIRQMIATVVNPSLSRRVWSNYIWRRSRETY